MSYNFGSQEEGQPTSTGVSKAKTLRPGVHYCTVASMKLTSPPYAPETNFIEFTLVAQKPSPDFVGFAIDKNNPDLGNYEGPIANVKHARYAFKTFTAKSSGKEIGKDFLIKCFLEDLAKQLGIFDEIVKRNTTCDTIEDLFDEVKRFVINPDLYAWWTIGGVEIPDGQYAKYQLNLVRYNNREGIFPFSTKEDKSDLVKFDRAVHVEIKAPAERKPVEVDSFGTGAILPSSFKPSPDDSDLPF